MRSNKLILGVLVAGGLFAAYWMLLLAPKREEVTALEAQVTAKQQEVAASEALLTGYRAARDGYKDMYSRLARLGKAVPSDDDVRSLVVQLDAAAKTSKVNFRSISVAGSGGPSTDAAGAAAAGPTPPPGAILSGSGGMATMPFALTFSGKYRNLSELFTELERFVAVHDDEIRVTGRLMRVDSIALIPKPGQLMSDLQATVSATTFVVPPTQQLGAAGAQPAAGGTTTPAGAPSDGSTPPTTTAAVTGGIE